ncbi:MAG: hypothetical protein WC711_02780 [Candidatus Staskawiczbacteria bacterium]
MNTLKHVKNSLALVVKTRLAGSIFASIVIAICAVGIILPQAIYADPANTASASYVAKNSNEIKSNAIKTIKVKVTAYSSTADQTDDTPFITASGKRVKDGIIANNLLPFGTKIKIPKLYGDKIFTVQDRMNKKKGNFHIDIWMPTRGLALNFGSKTAEILVLAD